MSGDLDFSPGGPSEEMAGYLQLYLDETSEQLEALTESLLVLEQSPTDSGQLNEAFRLVHSIKGSSAMMGLDSVTVLTHQLENHFERLRSGLQPLDQETMGLILRCIDFLKSCNELLRAGKTLATAPELLEELGRLGSGPSSAPTASPRRAVAPPDVPVDPVVVPPDERNFRITVRFEAELQLADVKAELVWTRLAELASIQTSKPPRAELHRVAEDSRLELIVRSHRRADELRAAADVGGVSLIEVEEGADELTPTLPVPVAQPPVEPEPAPAVPANASPDGGAKVVETLRVDIERLDQLMNLAGELVVNQARFVQVARLMGPAFKKSSFGARTRSLGETVRRVVRALTAGDAVGAGNRAGPCSHDLAQLEAELDMLDEQARWWEEGRRHFGQINEAIDQLGRVSGSLQRAVLDTRMVPVAPLFNRFKRVARDISAELGKRVTLEIRGENTELDKRMIDELSDPLVHLVRNAIDHGIEPADVRKRRGKPETGTLRLAAAHSGNSVLITVSDDGGGVNVDKVRERLIERGLVSSAAAEQLSDRQVIEFIWHPGFSTADAVTDVSGRGVGMDIVKTRIAGLNGTVAVEQVAGKGATFTIRLPLTLAIIRSLLFRVRPGVFATPIENVREIVAVPSQRIVSIHGRRTFDVRGEFIPLVDIDDVFDWNDAPDARDGASDLDPAGERVKIIVLCSANKTMGLHVQELLGTQEIVIKSLAENFVQTRGLAGASILGDGSVALLLDAAAAIDLASRAGGSSRRRRSSSAQR
jgi:two-component system chemotaxis sensor kinase CheA